MGLLAEDIVAVPGTREMLQHLLSDHEEIIIQLHKDV